MLNAWFKFFGDYFQFHCIGNRGFEINKVTFHQNIWSEKQNVIEDNLLTGKEKEGKNKISIFPSFSPNYKNVPKNVL